MERLLIAASLLLGGESAALACSRVPLSDNPAQLRELANAMARNATALVEVDVLTGYDANTRRGEQMRVRHTFAGRAPQNFRIARYGHQPYGSTCDVVYAPGLKTLVVIYPPDRSQSAGRGEFRDSGLCGSFLLQDARFRQMLVNAMRRRSTSAQPTASPPPSPCRNAA